MSICAIDIDMWPVTNTQPRAPVRFNHLPLGFLSPVILLDSKAQQTELEWISYPPNGVSLQNICITGTRMLGYSISIILPASP